MKKIDYLIPIIIILLICSSSNAVLAKEVAIGDSSQIELIKQTLTISGDTVKFVGIIASIILPLIIFLIGYQIFRSYQFEKDYRETRKLMLDEYQKLVKITSDSELFVNQTKAKLASLEDLIGTLVTDYLTKKTPALLKEEAERVISEIKTDEVKRSAELMKKLESLDLTLTPTVYIERGSIYLDQGNFEKAIENFDKALEMKDNQFDAYFDRGLAYIRMRKFDEAINDFMKAAEIQSKNRAVFGNLGACYIGKSDSGDVEKNLDKAMEYLNKAIELDPRYAFAYYQKARAFRYMKKYDLAINEMKEALKIVPDSEGYLHELALCYGKMGDFKSAIEFYSKSIEKKKRIGTLLNLTEAYICQKNYADAEKLAHECYSMVSTIRDKILSKYLLLLALILNNKEYRLELKSFVEVVSAESGFKILEWSFEEILSFLEDPALKKPAVELVKKIIGFLKGEIKGRELLPQES
jgi:Tfp pilus assembly protein PilF